MPRSAFVALVTGGTRGFGYNVSKELLKRNLSIVTFMAARGDTGGMDAILNMELGAGARKRGTFITMDVTDPMSIALLRDAIVKRYGGLDIIVNNAAIYEKPNVANFDTQAKRIIETNYFGTKNVVTSFSDFIKPNARIINITSNLAHVKEEITCEEEERKRKTRDRFDIVKNLWELDGLVLRFREDVHWGRCKEEGWPECAYTVSKMAINSYTRLLQEDFDRKGREDVVVNAVYPATKHSKIDQTGYDLNTDEEAASFIYYMGTTMPNIAGLYPRGDVVWDNSMTLLRDRSKAK